MKLNIDIADNIIIIRIEDEIDYEGALQLSESSKNAIEQYNFFDLIYDMQFVTKINSSTLGSLINILSLVNKGGGKIVIIPSNEVYRILKLLRLRSLFVLCNNVNEAIERLQENILCSVNNVKVS